MRRVYFFFFSKISSGHDAADVRAAAREQNPIAADFGRTRK